jgi:proline iminopeptidase
MFPDGWEAFLEPIPEAERVDMLGAYHRRLNSENEAVKRRAALAWSIWEGATSSLLASEALLETFGADAFALALARIETHYFVNRGFFSTETQLLDGVGRIRHLPCTIVQGRYDVVCPMDSAWALHRAWPEADLRIVPDAGHSAYEPGNTSELVRATDRYADKTTGTR